MLRGFVSNPFEFVVGSLIHDVAGVERGGGFKEQKPAFFVGYGTMLDAARHYDKLAFLDPFMTVTKLHPEAAFDHQEHFILVFMVVEDEFTLDLVELDILAVEFGGDVGLPVFGDFGELVGEVDFGHGILWSV
jgi:hypothetical protein